MKYDPPLVINCTECQVVIDYKIRDNLLFAVDCVVEQTLGVNIYFGINRGFACATSELFQRYLQFQVFFSIRSSSLRISEVQFPQDFSDIYFFRYFLATDPAPPGFRRSNSLGISVIFTFLGIFQQQIQLPQDFRDPAHSGFQRNLHFRYFLATDLHLLGDFAGGQKNLQFWVFLAKARYWPRPQLKCNFELRL